MDLIIYGFINSIILMLFSIGFSLAYGVSRIPNFAHGALYVFCACLTWILLNKLGMNYYFALVVAILATAVLGTLIYLLVLQRVRGMPFSELMASFAIGIAILGILRISGFRGPQYSLPKFIKKTIFIFGVPVDMQRILIILIGIALLILLYIFIHYTKIGLALRAIAQDEPAALMLGIDIDICGALSLGIGALLVAIAAVLIIPLGIINIETGYEVLIFALAVCIIGGLGSLIGTVVASFILGYLQILTVEFLNPTYQLIVALSAIILILLFKPSGFFGKQKELEERV